MMDALASFHFLRPLWLLAALPILGLWWVSRPKKTHRPFETLGVAPHLARALNVSQTQSARILPIDALMVAALALSIGVAGPTWSRAPNPLVADTAPLVIALKVTPSMEESDIAPSRLDRAKFKALDLIERRAGARNALIAYAGTAHRAAPLTEDPNILRPLLEGLSPAVMPTDGDAASDALALAAEILETAETAGAVLFILDDLAPQNVAAFTSNATIPVHVLIAAPSTVSVAQLDQIQTASLEYLTADDRDIDRIERRVRSDYAAALRGDDRLDWEDRAWWLA